MPNAECITVRNLLNYTSGIFNYTEDEEFLAKHVGFPNISTTPKEVVAVATTNGPTFDLNASGGYSDANYIILGMILAQHEGTTAGLSSYTLVSHPSILRPIDSVW